MKTKRIKSCGENDLAAKKYVKENRITVDNMMRLMKDYGQDGIDHLLEGLFLRGAEYANRAMIEKGCEWMERHLPQCIEIENNYVVVKNSFIDDFKKAMKGD